MQVVILCGGMGTRIRDVAEDIPKPMIPVGDRPILWHIMNGYARQGFKRFVLCLGYKSWTIKQFFLDYHIARSDITVDLLGERPIRTHRRVHDQDWEITLAETGLHTMTGGRVKAVEPYVDGDFLLTYGDGVSDINVHALVAFHRAHGKLGTVTAVRTPGRFGEIELDGPAVREFSEKPVVSPGRISGGYFVFNREFLDRLPEDPATVLEQEPLRELARAGELAAYRHDGFWHCMDNSRDYQLLNRMWADGDAPWDRPADTARRAAA